MNRLPRPRSPLTERFETTDGLGGRPSGLLEVSCGEDVTDVAGVDPWGDETETPLCSEPEVVGDKWDPSFIEYPMASEYGGASSSGISSELRCSGINPVLLSEDSSERRV